jgi:hypothetical protein
MFNSTTRTYTIQDNSGSYLWLVLNSDPRDIAELSDDALREYVRTHAETTIDMDIAEIEENVHEMDFPKMGYSTSQVWQNQDEYL